MYITDNNTCYVEMIDAPPPLQRLDVERETIELVHTNPTDTRDLSRRIPTDTPRYHFFLYKHSHEGDPLESIGTLATQSHQRGGVTELHVGRSAVSAAAHHTWESPVCTPLGMTGPIVLLQCSSTPCRATAVASRRGCCTPAARAASWKTWPEIIT